MAPRITLAGQVGIEVESRRTDAGGLGRLGRLALAYLVSERHRPVPRGELADVLWGEHLPRSWETSLRVVVSRLRSWLETAGLDGGDVLTSGFGCYEIHLPAGSAVDVEQAAANLAAARAALVAGDPVTAGSSARAAATAAAADFVPGGSGPWVERRQAELRDLRVSALEALSDAALAGGDLGGALAAAEEALTVDPLRESAHVRVMAAHSAAGNRGAALRAYERCRHLLAEELGVGPSPATDAAYLSLLGDERPEPAKPMAGPAAEAAPTEPPGAAALLVATSAFVGREAEVAEVLELVRSTRLVTLVGPGGMGKTRLAFEVATATAADFAAGARLVPLGDVSDPYAVPAHFLASLGLEQAPGSSPSDTLTSTLDDQQLLLVVDNCEHVIGGVALLVDRLLRACPRLTVLATSREALGVAGEVAWSVPPLDADDAVHLFNDRARNARRMFTLGPGDHDAVAGICRRLDGIPLAIELAAARVPVLSVAEIAERLEDRFSLLTTGPRTAPPRHQTLRAALDWSHDALSPGEQRLFRRLSVFPASFTLAAAERVAGTGTEGDSDPVPLLDPLASLVSRSLAVAEPGSTVPTRYRLLETIRAYAGEHLQAAGEETSIRARLQVWAADLAEEAEAHLDGPAQARWLDELEAEHANLLAAASTDPTALDALRLVTALGRFWEMRGHLDEGRRVLRSVLSESDSGPPLLRARAHYLAGVLAQRQGDYAAARSRYENSLAVRRSLGDRLGTAVALHGLGNLAALEGNMVEARGLYEESLAIGRNEGDLSLTAAALANLGWVAHAAGDFAVARPYYEQALALRRQQGDHHGIALVLGHLGDLAYQQGDYAGASDLHRQSLGLRRELGDRAGRADSLATLGHLAIREDDLDAARRHLEESLALRRELGDGAALPSALSNVADLALLTGDLRQARALLDEAEAVAVAGRDDPVLAHVLLHQGRLARAEGRLPQALKCYAQAWGLGGQAAADAFTAEWLEGVGATVALAGDPQAGARLLGAAEALRQARGLPVPPHEEGVHHQDLARLRAAMGKAAFDEAWRAGLALPVAEAVREAAVAVA